MQLTRKRLETQEPARQSSFFLAAYRDHLLTELAEVERRLAEFDLGRTGASPAPAIGFES